MIFRRCQYVVRKTGIHQRTENLKGTLEENLESGQLDWRNSARSIICGSIDDEGIAVRYLELRLKAICREAHRK